MDHTARLAERVARRVAARHPRRSLDQLLAEDVAGNELTTLLLHAFRQRALRRTFSELGAHQDRLAFTHASELDARKLHAFDGACFAAARGFDAVELAPVEPLGTAACAGVDPNHLLGTLRFAELVGDPTPALALQVRTLRRRGVLERVKLCASQRVLRLQPFEQPGFTPHFRLFALVSAERAARGSEDDRTERQLLREQLEVWAELFPALGGSGFVPGELSVVLADTRLVRASLRARGADPDRLARGVAAHRPESTERALREARIELPRAAPDASQASTELGLGASERAIASALDREIAEPLRARGASVSFDFARLQGLAYYAGPMVQIGVRHDSGEPFSIGDGGALGWLGELLSDRRQRSVATGIGSELYVRAFSR